MKNEGWQIMSALIFYNNPLSFDGFLLSLRRIISNFVETKTYWIMKKYLFLLLITVLLSCCTSNYNKDIVGWWVADDAGQSEYVYYIIRDDGTYKKRMKTDLIDGTDRGTWEIKGSRIFFNVLTYNNKEQNGRKEERKIKSLSPKRLILETNDGTKFVYLNLDNKE